MDERDCWVVKELGEYLVVKVLVDVLRFYFEFYEVDGLGWCVYLYDLFVVVNVVIGRFVMMWLLVVDVELIGMFICG